MIRINNEFTALGYIDQLQKYMGKLKPEEAEAFKVGVMQQLKEQNAALDSRVAEKTQALIERSEQHHRAYVLLRSVINGIPEFIIFNDSQNKLTGCNKSFLSV